MSESRFESLVSDLETSEQLNKGVLTSVLRLTSNDNLEGELISVLERVKEERETEIHELCGGKFKALLSGMQLVNAVCEAAGKARNSLVTLQGGIADVSNTLLSAKEKIAPIQSQLSKLSSYQSSLRALQTSVQTLKKAQGQISQLRLLSALRNLKESKEVASTGKNDKAAQLIVTFAEKLEETVSKQVDEMLTEWLYSVRRNAEAIGAQLFSESSERVRALRAKNAKRQARATRDSPLLSLKLSQLQPRKLNHYLTARESLTHAPAARLSTVLDETHLSNLDFPHLCQLQSVFVELNREKEFLESLKRNRRAQIMQVSTLSLAVRTRLEALAGHLCVEKELMVHDDRWRSDEELQEIWLEVLSVVSRMVEELVRQAQSCDEILQVKEALTLFIDTLQKAGFTQRCYELLELMRNNHWSFFTLLVDNFKDEAERVVGEDDYTPLGKDSPLEAAVATFELDDGSPNYYKFSSLVPHMCTLFSKYTQKNLEFLEDLQDSVDEVLFQNTDRMLHVLNEIITDQTRSATVLQTGMLAVDVTFLFRALNAYYLKLVEVTGSVKDFSARTAFMQLKDTCEQAIFSKIQDRMRELLNTVTDLSPSAARRQDWVPEALMYLEHTASSLERLCGQQVAATALITTLKFISNSLIKTLENCVKFNAFFVLELNFVGKDIEDFIGQSSICRETPGLIDALEELKQLTNLFITNDLMSLLDPNIRQSKYPRLNLTTVASILEKFKEVKGQNPKASVVKSVLKKLKDILK